MKRILSIFLMLTLCISSSVTSFADFDRPANSARLGGGDSHIIIQRDAKCATIDQSDLDAMADEVLAAEEGGLDLGIFQDLVDFIGGFIDKGTVSYADAKKKSFRNSYIKDFFKFKIAAQKKINSQGDVHIIQKYVMYEDEGEWVVIDAPEVSGRSCSVCN